ncbi:MAG TPA: hypothetical protein VES97_03315, partial [Solirubrobacteraceae bacterium]|nr:hypothetical protein [Solirubrobacteraceae bacterium]
TVASGKPLAARPRLVLVAALAVMVVMAVWAQPARAGWSAPATISAPHDQIGALQLASGPFGDLLSWKYWDLVGSRGIFGAPGARLAVAGPGGSFSRERRLPSSYATGPLVDLGQGHVAQLTFVPSAGNTTALEVRLGEVDGRFGAAQRIRASMWAARASLAGNWRGELLLAWISSPRSGHRQVWASTRPAGGRFGPPQLLSARANGLSVTAAVGPAAHRTDLGGFASDMVVAFDSKRGRMLARVRPHLRPWGPVQDIGPAAVGSDNEVAPPSIGRDGRVTIAWYHEQLSEGGPLGPGYVQVAVLPPGAHRFQAAQTLERDPPSVGVGGEPRVVADDGHGRIVAFLAHPSAPAGGMVAPAVVKVAYGKGSRFGAPRRISPAGQDAGDLSAAEGERGEILSWIREDPPSHADGTVYVAIDEPPENGLGAPQQASPPEHVSVAVPAYSPSSGRWIVAWAGRPLYQTMFAPGPMLVRESFCPEPCR